MWLLSLVVLLLVVAGLSPGCLTAVVLVLPRGAGSGSAAHVATLGLQSNVSLKANIWGFMTCVCLSPHTRRKIPFPVQTATPAVAQSSWRVSCGHKTGFVEEPAPAMRSGRSDL